MHIYCPYSDLSVAEFIHFVFVSGNKVPPMDGFPTYEEAVSAIDNVVAVLHIEYDENQKIISMDIIKE